MPRIRGWSGDLVVVAARLAGGALLLLGLVALVARFWVGAASLGALAALVLWGASRAGSAARAAQWGRAEGGTEVPSLESVLSDRGALIEKLRALSEPELRDFAARLFRKLGHHVSRGAEAGGSVGDDLVLRRDDEQSVARCFRVGEIDVNAARELVRTVREGPFRSGYAVCLDDVSAEVSGILQAGGVTVVGPQRLAYLAESVAGQSGDGSRPQARG